MKLSRLGSYQGYSNPVANGYVRTSQYVKVRDGCLLAIDVLHPAMDGKPLGGRRPVVVRGTGYRRSFRRGERIAYDVSRIPTIEKYPIGFTITPYELAPVATRLVDHGYVFVSVDVRGTGASFGSYDQPATLQTGRDLADIIDWIAQQDWSDGKIGMWGRSWEAAIQLVTTVAGTRNLTCICPLAIGSQMESTWYGGMFATGFRWPYNEMRKAMELDELATPVDGPEGEAMRDEAASNRPGYFPWPDKQALGEAYKDGAYAVGWLERSLACGAPIDPALTRPRTVNEDVASINACGAAVYWIDGWWDLNFINSAVSLYKGLTVPKKLTVGPWTHSQFAMAHEPHRWFDFWLKGIDNGIMIESPVQYSVSTTSGVTRWRGADDLPVAGTQSRKLYLSVPAGADARREGVLSEASGVEQALQYTTDYEVSTGPQTRTSYLWKSVQMKYGDLSHRLGRVLTFTTPPLTKDVELTGVPTLRLPLAVSASTAAIFATLEDVQPNGSSRYLTEGVLNLEYRAALPLPEHYFGAVLHPVFPSDKKAIQPSQRMDIVLDMLALSSSVPAGHSLRLTIAGADQENYYLAPCNPPTTITLWSGGDDGASVELPIVEGANIPAEITGTFEQDPLPFAFET